MPKQARQLSELLEERDQWKQEVSAFFVATRSAASLSQSSFAKDLAISQPYLSQIENGERTPSSETLNKLFSYVKGEESGNTSTDQD